MKRCLLIINEDTSFNEITSLLKIMRAPLLMRSQVFVNEHTSFNEIQVMITFQMRTPFDEVISQMRTLF